MATTVIHGSKYSVIYSEHGIEKSRIPCGSLEEAERIVVGLWKVFCRKEAGA
jgi:hypothetical protein